MKERALSGRVEEPLGGGIPQTLPEGVRSFGASKKLKLLTQQASPIFGEGELETAEKSLIWIRQCHCPFFVFCVRGLNGAVQSLETRSIDPT